jgi:hypothetical protein
VELTTKTVNVAFAVALADRKIVVALRGIPGPLLTSGETLAVRSMLPANPLRLVTLIVEVGGKVLVVPQMVAPLKGSPAIVVPRSVGLPVSVKFATTLVTTLKGSQGLITPLLLGSPL